MASGTSRPGAAGGPCGIVARLRGHETSVHAVEAAPRPQEHAGVVGLQPDIISVTRHHVDLAAQRIRAAREAIGDSGTLLVARAECFLVGVTKIDEVIRRLTAYANAGADCLYAPGIRERDHISAVVAAVAPKPVNILIGSAIGLTMSDAAALGVRRVSVGGALARASWGGFIRAAKELAEHGTFDGFAGATPHAELQEFFIEVGNTQRS